MHSKPSYSMKISTGFYNLFFNDPMIKGRIPLVEHSVVNGLISPSQAVTELIRCFDMDRAAIKHMQSGKL